MNPPRTKNVAHMFDAPDDWQPPIKLCRGYAKNFTINQPREGTRNIGAPSPFDVQREFATMNVELKVVGALNHEALETLRTSVVEIFIRRVK